MQFDWKHPTVAMLGAYQPWTEDDTKTFCELVKKTKQVVIWVQEADKDVKRPMDFIFVRDNIQNELQHLGFNHEEEYVIQPVPYVTEFHAQRKGEYTTTAD